MASFRPGRPQLIIDDRTKGKSGHSLFKLRPLATLIALVLGYQVAAADEAGVSIWLPGTFGSLAAAPVQPGFQWSTTYYHAAATSQSRKEFEEGGRIVTGLSPKPHLIQLSPSYAFETPVLGAQLGVALTTVPAFVSNRITSTLVGPRGRTLSGAIANRYRGSAICTRAHR